MRILLSPGFRLDILRVPASVALWAADFVVAAASPDYSFADLTAGARLLRSRSGNVYSRRRRGHRLVFRANREKNEVTFVAVRKREDVYEVAAERIGEKH